MGTFKHPFIYVWRVPLWESMELLLSSIVPMRVPLLTTTNSCEDRSKRVIESAEWLKQAIVTQIANLSSGDLLDQVLLSLDLPLNIINIYSEIVETQHVGVEKLRVVHHNLELI